MFRSLCKNLPLLRSSIRASEIENPCFVQLKPLSDSPKKTKGTKGYDENQRLFVVNYFMNTFGFTKEKAFSAMKCVKFGSPEKPDSVICFLEKHGFTETQICTIATKNPPVFLCDPEKILLPKLQFFRSIGLSGVELCAMASSSPRLLSSSLEKRLIPSFEFIKGLLGSHEKSLRFLRSACSVICYDLRTDMMQNIQLLKELGTPEDNICKMFLRGHTSFLSNHDKFKKAVEEVKEMGFNPTKMTFLYAIHALKAMTKPTWEKKVNVYKKFGWSENDILEAFGKCPMCMTASEDKIMGVMDLLVNKMGFEASLVLKRPIFMCLSLQGRIIPRCMVYGGLCSKGLLSKKFSLGVFLEVSERKFLKKFVEPFGANTPELLMLYQKNLPLSTKDGQNHIQASSKSL